MTQITPSQYLLLTGQAGAQVCVQVEVPWRVQVRLIVKDIQRDEHFKATQTTGLNKQTIVNIAQEEPEEEKEEEEEKM